MSQGIPNVVAQLFGNMECGPQGDTIVARSWLHENFLAAGRAQDLAVHLAIERDAAGNTQMLDLVLIDQLARQRHGGLFQQVLRGPSDIDIHVRRILAL